MLSNVTTRLKEKVEARLQQNKHVKDFPIEVIDNNGMITLQGEVSSDVIAMIVEGLTRQVEGVVSVTNELTVPDPSKEGFNPHFPAVPPTQR